VDETYYYAGGRRVRAFRLTSARVVQVPEDRDTIAIHGWRTVPTGHKKYQLLVKDDVTSERMQPVTRLEDLVPKLIEAETSNPELREARLPTSSANIPPNVESVPALVSEGGALLLPTGEVAAKFKPGNTAEMVEQTARSYGATSVRRLPSLPDTYVLSVARGEDGLRLAQALVESGKVEFASPNFIEEMPFRAVPQNRLFGEQWHLNNTGQNGAVPRADIRILEAWEITRGSADITICILDSGVESRHESFSAPGKLVQGFDFADNDPIADPTTSSHGTSCAGLVAATWGTGAVVGVAPDCRILPVRRSTLSEHAKVAEALAWAANNGADVINCSFGYDGRPWILPDIVRSALDYVTSSGRGGKGTVVVWAAGNGNELVSADEWASYEKVIAVAACTDLNTRAPYSDFGPEVEICAPSSGGINGITTTSNGGYTAAFGGTSAAAPIVAGTVGLLLSVNPNLTVGEVRSILRSSADRVDPVNGAYDNDGHSQLYGFGRVNALRALHAISALQEAVRGSNVEQRLPALRAFAATYLMPRAAGQSILQFLDAKKFRTLALLKSQTVFRRHAVTVLRATADLYDALQSNTAPQISEEVWPAVREAVRLLNESENRDVNNPEEQTIMPENNLDDILNRLAGALQGSGGPTGTGTSTSTGTGANGPGTGSGSVISAGNGTGSNGAGGAMPDPAAFREMLATELGYMQSIPPLTDELIMELDEYFANLPEQLKELKNRPVLSMQVSAATAGNGSGGSGDRMILYPSSVIIRIIEEVLKTQTRPTAGNGNRSEIQVEDPELVALGTKMARDISGLPEERVLPLVALAIGAAVAAMVGGVTVGRAAYEATHPRQQ
jgi:subtilisin family serine protease